MNGDKVILRIPKDYISDEDWKLLWNKRATILSRISMGSYMVQLEEKINYSSEWLTIRNGEVRVAIGYCIAVFPCLKCEGSGNEGFLSVVRCTECGGTGEERKS
jgi:hypothetical protein